jgi:hypothetical protein
MTIGLSSEAAPVGGQKTTVLRRVSCSFEPDGSIRFEGTICDRLTIDGQAIDVNYRTVGATYPNEAAMIALAAANWNPTKDQQAAMAAAMGSTTGSVTVILQGFVGISLKAVDLLLNPPAPSPEDV